jgi:hypothetical protein
MDIILALIAWDNNEPASTPIALAGTNAEAEPRKTVSLLSCSSAAKSRVNNLGLVCQFGNKNRSKYGCKQFSFHFEYPLLLEHRGAIQPVHFYPQLPQPVFRILMQYASQRIQYPAVACRI